MLDVLENGSLTGVFCLGLNRAARSFRQLLYIDPVYCRANEVHLRLGLIFKVTGDLESSLKHFQLTLIDSAACSFTQNEGAHPIPFKVFWELCENPSI